MKPTIHTGQFIATDGTTWRVDIWDTQAAPRPAGELTFDGSEAVTIEWGETSTSEAVEGSTATIHIVSPADRTYADLYTIKAGRVGVDIYRAGSLYWVGVLDAEFYEEPYEAAAGYVVSLTFSDFGLLDRAAFALEGVPTLRQLVTAAMERAGLERLPLDTSRLSTTAAGAPDLLDHVALRADNFADEEGQPATLREALGAALLGLGLRIRQRAGRVHLYDLNALATDPAATPVDWTADSQTMGVAPVANNVQITFSPYTAATLLGGDEVKFGGRADAVVLRDAVRADDDSAPDYGRGVEHPELSPYWFFIHPLRIDMTRKNSERDYWAAVEQAMQHEGAGLLSQREFALFLDRRGRGVAYLDPDARYFRTIAAQGGSSSDGIAWRVATPSWLTDASRYVPPLRNAVSRGSARELMRTRRVYVSPDASGATLLNLSLEVLLSMSPTYGVDGKGIWAENSGAVQNPHLLKILTGWGFVPFALNLYNAAGEITHHYTNRATSEGFALLYQGHWGGTWEAGRGQMGDAWLAYYTAEDIKENAGFSDTWAKNRQNIGRPDHGARTGLSFADDKAHVFAFSKSLGEGQLIPMPPVGGWLEVTIYEGVRCFDYGESGDFATTHQWTKHDLYDKVRWLLYKAPRLEVVRSYGAREAAEMDDLVLRATLHPDAKETISVDLTCGTAPDPLPTARGIYRQADTGAPIATLTRGGQTAPPAVLLINTLYSQHATRHVTLSGEARLDPTAMTHTDTHQGTARLRIAAETQHLLTGTADLVLVETSPDQYAPLTYE